LLRKATETPLKVSHGLFLRLKNTRTGWNFPYGDYLERREKTPGIAWRGGIAVHARDSVRAGNPLWFSAGENATFPSREKEIPMKIPKSALWTFAFAGAMLLGHPRISAAQESTEQDLKDAGHDTKDASKDTGRATKHAAKKTGHAVKKGTNKAADKTEEGAYKVKEKTEPN
jgi:hypothetical protein